MEEYVLNNFLNTAFLSNTVEDYLIAIATFLVALLVIRIVKSVVVGRIKKWSRHTATDLDDRLIRIIEQPTLLLLSVGAFYIGVGNLSLHPVLQQSFDVVCVAVGTVLVIQLLGSLVEYGARLYLLKRGEDPAMEQTINAVVPAVKVIVWAIGLVFLLDNLGFDISAVVAGLGIGGIAIALAAQGVLGDLFSYVSILFDRPFELGDFIVVGDLVGTVEHIGLKTTRLRSLTGEELVIANTDITASRIQNYKRMARRRIAFNLGVTYETTAVQMKQIPGIIQEIVENVDSVTFDRAHFSSYGDFSLNYEVVYYVETNDYEIYMDAKQLIYLAIKEAFEARSIEFAYPTQTLYIDGVAVEDSPKGSANGRQFSISQTDNN
ncbi:mechanosensitive ion channel family protein [Leptolyngbya cf. ectocarpi LEGE 11479]|uniref:Mechanosensitive ion channel family protein n=1 Tax=Leptolyngbya cf. ectocarpi LEGE 11479 TaxID=1828722 RepID=A0A928WZB5_LEPEC|nr:mechanosensitive ion channel family protein [Leptolyngbya cf. ectocarpi LEGE 11479]